VGFFSPTKELRKRRRRDGGSEENSLGVWIWGDLEGIEVGSSRKYEKGPIRREPTGPFTSFCLLFYAPNEIPQKMPRY
jgi:hypothetical protein